MRYARSMREHRGQMSAIAHSCAACGNDLPVGSGRIRTHLGELERRTEAVNMELENVDRYERERIAGARMEGGPTNVVEPEPPIVPEPEPVPHVPPGPVIVPEPEPAPHEPPGPVIVPEPEPPSPSS